MADPSDTTMREEPWAPLVGGDVSPEHAAERARAASDSATFGAPRPADEAGAGDMASLAGGAVSDLAAGWAPEAAAETTARLTGAEAGDAFGMNEPPLMPMVAAAATTDSSGTDAGLVIREEAPAGGATTMGAENEQQADLMTHARAQETGSPEAPDPARDQGTFGSINQTDGV